MKIVFVGSGPFAVPVLERLVERAAPHDLAAVVTRPDRPARRGRRLLPTPVGQRARELGLDVLAPRSANEPEALDALRARRVDLLLVADYGELLRPGFLSLATIGAYNLHASVLPRHRGAAPVAHAILAGDDETGVSLFRIEEALDSGPVVATVGTRIRRGETAGELEERLAVLAAGLAVESLDAFAEGTYTETAQDHALATRAPKLRKEMGWIDFREGATTLERQVLALNPWPMAHALDLDAPGGRPVRTAILRAEAQDAPASDGAAPGTVVRVDGGSFDVACARGALRVLEVQREGKKAMDAAAYIRGRRLEPGARFGEPAQEDTT